jgi:ABC-type sugar transport system permease subunit
VATETTAKATLGQRTVRELKEIAILTGYLYVTLGAVILMKAAVLNDAGISFTPWGIAAVKALVLAKFMLLGRAMKIGERFHDRPLIWPTLHKSFAFLVLLVVLSIIEEVVVGLFHHQSVAASLGELTGAKLYETLAGIAIMLLVLIPYIAWGVLDEALGEGRLARMFFAEGGRGASSSRIPTGRPRPS